MDKLYTIVDYFVDIYNKYTIGEIASAITIGLFIWQIIKYLRLRFKKKSVERVYQSSSPSLAKRLMSDEDISSTKGSDMT